MKIILKKVPASMKIMFFKNFILQALTLLTSLSILIPAYNMERLAMERQVEERGSEKACCYTAIRMVEEVLAGHECSESGGEVVHLSGKVLFSSRAV
jgi:hypothetical protein